MDIFPKINIKIIKSYTSLLIMIHNFLLNIDLL